MRSRDSVFLAVFQYRATGRRTGVTLVELLVVIAVIGILAALALAAVQAAREAARRVECTNHAKQLALACLQHENLHGHLPTGGWGGAWVGDPDRGFGRAQPGGWAYNVLPFLEQGAVHRLGAGLSYADKKAVYPDRMAKAVPTLNCPSRRTAAAYPLVRAYTTQPYNSHEARLAARSDYAMNCGDQDRCEVPHFGGPANLIEGDRRSFRWPDTSDFTGVGFLRSAVRSADLDDGTTNVYLLGEKYVSRGGYRTGTDHGDDWSLYCGFQDDLYRSTNRQWPPSRDQKGPGSGDGEEGRFGSAHSAGWNVALCDGSVRLMRFDLDPRVHQQLGHRADGLPLGQVE